MRLALRLEFNKKSLDEHVVLIEAKFYASDYLLVRELRTKGARGIVIAEPFRGSRRESNRSCSTGKKSS
jgi:hypothetical protein